MNERHFARLLASIKQADEIIQGARAPSREFKVDADGVRAVRQATGLSQADFALMLDVPVGTVRNWEQGLRNPTGPARTLIRILKAKPKLALQALRAAA